MKSSYLGSWLLAVQGSKGHKHLYQEADEVLAQIQNQDVQQGLAGELFAQVLAVLAREVETSVSNASHPGATMQSYHFFRSLEVSGEPYIVSGGWARHMDRVFDLLHQFHDTLYTKRGWTAFPIDSDTAGKLAAPLYKIQGSALRGPRFDVKIAANLARLSSILEKVGFRVPLRDVELFSDSEGPSDESIFSIEEDVCFRALLAGAAKSRDPHAKRILTYFVEDEEGWVSDLAHELLATHFHEDQG